MRFSISNRIENNLKLIVLHDLKLKTEVAILPELGASLHAFRISSKSGPLNIVDNYQSAEEAEKILDRSYKSSKLSPFTCRIANGKYRFANRDLEFHKKFPDGSAIHGLLFNKIFLVAEQISGEDRAAVRLSYVYERDDPAYPFDYRCEISYSLEPENRLTLQTLIFNLGESEIPIADGWHPYFSLGSKIDDCELQFSAGSMLEFDGHLIPTGNLYDYNLFRDSTQIGQINLDNCFLPSLHNESPLCRLYNPSNGIELLFYTDGSYPFLQIFTPDSRQSIAIENLSGAPDCFNNGMGLVLLAPNSSKTFSVIYQVRINEKANLL
jgi:aldose 1-epimerase